MTTQILDQTLDHWTLKLKCLSAEMLVAYQATVTLWLGAWKTFSGDFNIGLLPIFNNNCTQLSMVV